MKKASWPALRATSLRAWTSGAFSSRLRALALWQILEEIAARAAEHLAEYIERIELDPTRLVVKQVVDRRIGEAGSRLSATSSGADSMWTVLVARSLV